MDLSLSTLFQIFLSDIFEKVRCYSACCSGQVIVEDHCELEESTDKESQRYSGEDFDTIDQTLSSTVPKKDSLNFFSDYYFDTKSPVAFTSLLALYREAKKRYPSLTFHQVKTWLRSKDTYTLNKPVRYNFPRNRVIIIGIDDQWQADLADIWLILTTGTNFYSPASMYFRNLLGLYHLKTS